MAPNVAMRKRLAKKGQANKDGSYPTDTKGRAVAAKGRATQAVKKGRMSKAQEAKIDARANRKLGKGKKTRARKHMPKKGRGKLGNVRF